MPHIIVEHTDLSAHSVDINTLNKNLHDCLSKQESVSLDAIKTRSIEVKNVYVGGRNEKNFIHVTVLLLAGRPKWLKETMAEALHVCAQSHLTNIECRVSVNIEELGVYKK